MIQLFTLLSTGVSGLGDSMWRIAHGVFALAFFSRIPNFKFRPTLSAPVPSPLVDAPTTSWGASELWSPHPANELAVVDAPQASQFVGERIESYQNSLIVAGGEDWNSLVPLILLSLLALVCLSFASELHFLYSRLFACATSIAARLSAAVHSECSVTIKLKDAELIEKRSALDIALQQIEQGNARIESLYAESRALSSVALDQGRDIRIQSNLIAELEGQLEDTESALEEAIVSGRQHELEAYAYSQEVARVEDRMSTLVAEFNIAYSMMVLNLDSAHAREQQLCKSLDAKNALISDAQAALSASEEAAGKERETLQCELDTWTQNGRHWKAMAEEAEIRTVDADQTALGLRKELAAVYKSAREVKEQLESQAVIIGERDMTIRTLNREVLEVLEQLEEAEDEIARFQSLPDPIDFADVEAWQPPSEPEADSPDSMPARSPPVFEWLGRLTKGDRELSAPRTQARSRSPDMSIGEFTSGHRGVASPKASSGPCDGILLCLASPVASAATPDDPFLVGGVPVSASRQRNPTYPVPGVADSCGMADSMVSHVKMIGELREQIVREQLACAQAEERLLAQQRKMLATEAVVEIQRRQLEYTSAQKVELVKSLAMNVTLGNEVGTLRQQAEAAKAGRHEMAARVTQLEATLSESRTALKAVTKTTEEMRVQWNDAEAVCEARAKEIDAVKAEQDAVDMRLSQMMLLKLALEERVKTLEEAASNRAGSSDRAGARGEVQPDEYDGKSDSSFTMEASPSLEYIPDIHLPSSSSWGCISDDPPPRFKPGSLLPMVTVTCAGSTVNSSSSRMSSGRGGLARACASIVRVTPSRGRLTAVSRLGSAMATDGLVASESTLSLMFALTPPGALPSPPARSTSSLTSSDISSPRLRAPSPRRKDHRALSVGESWKKKQGTVPQGINIPSHRRQAPPVVDSTDTLVSHARLAR